MELQEMLDRAEITRVVNDWGLCRDTGRWDALRALYAPGGTMRTTWCDCSAEEFVDRSIQSAARGSFSGHFIGASTIRVNHKRAIAETRMVLMLRAEIEGVKVDVACQGRFYDQFVKTEAGWRILHRVPVYDKDRLDPVEPGRTVHLDPERLARFAEGYRHIAHIQSLGGMTLTPGLPTRNSPEEAKLLADGDAWLNGDHS